MNAVYVHDHRMNPCWSFLDVCLIMTSRLETQSTCVLQSSYGSHQAATGAQEHASSSPTVSALG